MAYELRCDVPNLRIMRVVGFGNAHALNIKKRHKQANENAFQEWLRSVSGGGSGSAKRRQASSGMAAQSSGRQAADAGGPEAQLGVLAAEECASVDNFTA